MYGNIQRRLYARTKDDTFIAEERRYYCHFKLHNLSSKSAIPRPEGKNQWLNETSASNLRCSLKL